MKEELKNKEIALTRKFNQEIRKIVQEIRREMKYTVIFEKKMAIAADDAIDITDVVIRRYDRAHSNK